MSERLFWVFLLLDTLMVLLLLLTPVVWGIMDGTRMRTWMKEQIVLGTLVLVSIYLQFHNMAAETNVIHGTQVIVVLASGVLTMAMQQLRSIGDRQYEQNKLRGINNAPMSCSSQLEQVSFIAQVLSVAISMVTAATWVHVLISFYSVGYLSVWRKYYRKWHPAILEE